MSTIHHEVLFDGSPQRVYEALTETKKFSQVTGGAPAEIGSKAGDAFSCFGGHITGRHIEMVPAQLLVQAWRAKTWPQGEYSIVRFDLKPEGKKTKLIFDHTGYPEDQRAHLEQGWNEQYWKGLQAFLRA